MSPYFYNIKNIQTIWRVMNKKISNKLKFVLIISLLIVLFASLEALMNAKSVEAFNSYKVVFPDHTADDYIDFTLMNYVYNIIETIIISLFLFFTRDKLRPNKLYAIVFGGMILIKLVNKILSFNINSIFYYILLILYILLLISVVRYCGSTEEER